MIATQSSPEKSLSNTTFICKISSKFQHINSAISAFQSVELAFGKPSSRFSAGFVRHRPSSISVTTFCGSLINLFAI